MPQRDAADDRLGGASGAAAKASSRPTTIFVSSPAAGDIDWTRSAAIFIGVQTFHRGSDLEVAYAADDAVDLAWLFIHELKLLKPEQTALLLAGVPAKESSRRHLAKLRQELRFVEDDRRVPHEACINADSIDANVRAQARRVGKGGINRLLRGGLTRAGLHRLLTAGTVPLLRRRAGESGAHDVCPAADPARKRRRRIQRPGSTSARRATARASGSRSTSSPATRSMHSTTAKRSPNGPKAVR